MPNQPKTPMHSLRVDDALWQAAKAAAAANGETLADVVRRALAGYVRRSKEKKPRGNGEGPPEVWQPIYPNELPKGGARAPDQSPTDTGLGVLRCYNCGHAVWEHFREGVAGGCIATKPPAVAIESAIRGQARKPFIGSDRCLCPGWTRGQLPHALIKHLTRVTDDEDVTCPRCEHPLIDHSEEQGCHTCPCTIHAHPR